MKCIDELIGLEIEHCPECHCAVGDDWEYRDFSNRTIAVCPQCKNEIKLIGFVHIELEEQVT